jgi:hypothetical protein
MTETISIDDLAHVCGGAAAWDAYVKEQRGAVAAPYKDIVCTGAGVKGGPQFAEQVYGANRTTGNDMVRAAKALRNVCIGGRRLPSAAPQTPF